MAKLTGNKALPKSNISEKAPTCAKKNVPFKSEQKQFYGIKNKHISRKCTILPSGTRSHLWEA